jgi:hypothetical protein
MKKHARIGCIADISILRATGEALHLGRIHNVIGNNLALKDARTEMASPTENVTLFTMTTVVKTALTGTWSQAGTTVSRASGSDTLPATQNILLVFGTGEQSYKTAGSGTSCTSSRSATIAATTLAYYNTAAETSSGAPQTKSTFTGMTRSYSAGELKWALPSSFSFDPASSGYTLARVGAFWNLSGAVYVHFDLPAPVVILTGDQVIVNSLELIYTYDDHEPRAFAVSPISGLTGTGTFQRLRTVATRENFAPTRIFLISDANKITIPNMLAPGAAVINPASITLLETVTATGSKTDAAVANTMTQANSCFGTIVTGGTVKQIAWGTTTELFGIVEYDTPVAIAAGKVLTIGGSLQLEIEVP